MWFLNEHKGVGHLSDLVEWGALVHGPSPVVVENKDGSYMATLWYQGENVRMLEPEARAGYLHRLNQQLMRLGTGWCLLADQWHEPVTTYPTSSWQNPAAAFVDAARRAQLASGALLGSDQFLTLTWHPGSQIAAKWYDRWLREAPPATDKHLSRAAFVHDLTRWSDGLTGLFPDWHMLDADDTLTYLQRCVSWRRHRLRCPALPTNLAHTLTVDDWLPGDTLQLGRPIPGSQPPRLERYVRPIGIQAWPKGTLEDGGGLGIDIPPLLEALPFPYRFSVRYLFLDVADAEKALRTYKGRWENMVEEAWTGPASLIRGFLPGNASRHVDSTERGLQSLRAGEVHYGYVTPTITVWGDTMEELTYREREIIKLLHNEGVSPVPETANACQAWVGSLPGDTKHNAVRDLFPSLGLSFLVPHSTIWSGEPRDSHLKEPCLFMASSDMAPFYFSLHSAMSEAGNVMILGPTRSGKSGLLGLMMSQFHRYDGQIFCFDKDYALYAMTVLHGGTHYDFGSTDGIGIQPLGHLDAGEYEQRWSLHWLIQVMESQGEVLSPDDREQLWFAIQRLASFPAALRTLTGYVECLQVPRLKQALAPYLAEGPYAFLDADHDDIAFHDFTTFEMRHLLGMPDVLPHVLRCVFHRLERRFTGRPTAIVLDESRKLLADAVFGPEILDFLKERAKVGVHTVLCTQEVVDFSASPAAQAILGSVGTWVFLPNPAAMQPSVADFYRECGLTDSHKQLLTLSSPKQDYLYKAGQRVQRFQLVLSPLDRALVAASTPEELAELRQLQREELKEPLVSAWLRRRGFEREAAIFRDEYVQEVFL